MVDQAVRFEALSALLGDDVIPIFSTNTSITPEDFLGMLFTREMPCEYNAVKRHYFVHMETFFDEQYDWDFTNLSLGFSEASRGGESYNRPSGWYRMALRVRNKYPDGNIWLGADCWRDESAPGEWPVSYHGTGIDGAKGIIQSHYKTGTRAFYGRGVYSTPCLSKAQVYTKEFTSKSNGKTYRVVMQNRINPLQRVICDNKTEWLVPVAAHLSSQQERDFVESSIRPYGILIQEATGEPPRVLVDTPRNRHNPQPTPSIIPPPRPPSRIKV